MLLRTWIKSAKLIKDRNHDNRTHRENGLLFLPVGWIDSPFVGVARLGKARICIVVEVVSTGPARTESDSSQCTYTNAPSAVPSGVGIMAHQALAQHGTGGVVVKWHQALAQHGTGRAVVKWHQALAQHGTGAVVIMLIMAHQALAQHGTRHLPFPLIALIFVLVVAMSPQ